MSLVKAHWNGHLIFVSTENIQAIKYNSMDCQIVYENNTSVYIDESPEKIYDLIERASKEVPDESVSPPEFDKGGI